MNYEEWKGWWEKHSPEYFTDKIYTFSRPDLIERFGLHRDSRILELGFGYGRELSQFCKRSNHVYGLELTDFACDHVTRHLHEKGVDPLPVVAPYDGVNIPELFGHANINESRDFDLVYSCFVIQHISKAHAHTLCGNVLDRLKEGGSVLFEFFGDPAFRCPTDDVMSENEEWGPMYNNAYTKQEIKKLIFGIGGSMLWIDEQKITKEWSNYWACFTRG